MKLNAAHRLLAADDHDTPTADSLLIGVHKLLTERGIDNDFPDDMFNSLIITSDFSSLLNAMSDWTITEREITTGGLYTYGLFMMLERGGEKLKLLYTSTGRASLWLI